MPKDHPARDMQDTFWLKQEAKNEKGEKQKLVARTHTSNTQVRYMEKYKPPFRIIVPGRTFRYESTDAFHEHTFFQFEALVVGDDISIANFKDVAEKFFTLFFERDVTIRLRPSYFPFTEPSFEFDISCTVCDGKGCSSCKHSGWLELGGAGMVNQKVFESAGYERGRYQGFAWGFGLNRLAMMKYKINDIRLFAGGDLRFIKQF
jgi:phenylalanyl-tRNA synthetase alpha chain